MSIVSLGIAFIAGVLSFLSPCVLPLVPAYISYITGSSIQKVDSQKVLKKAFLFVLGFSIIFMLLGITATAVSQFLYTYRDILNKIAGIILIILGINLMGVIKIKWLYKEWGKGNISEISKNPLLIGLAFGFGWTPCVGPILAGILVIAGNMDTIAQGITLLVVYSLGLGVPFILTALLIGKVLKVLKNISKYGNIISIISGVLIIVFGIIIFFNKMIVLNQIFIAS